MVDIKLQIGCTIVLLYIMIVYYRGRARYGLRLHPRIFDALMAVGLLTLLLDGATAYTVNHTDTVNPVLNLALHGAFLVSIDLVIFVEFLYILDMVRGLPRGRAARAALCLPFAANALVVLLFLDDLEYRTGALSHYSMGIPAYTCFAMAAVYTLLTAALALRYMRALPPKSAFPSSRASPPSAGCAFSRCSGRIS